MPNEKIKEKKLKKPRKKFITPERISRLPASILFAVVLSLFVFVVAPFEIYCNNVSEFTFSLGDFIGIQLLYALMISVLLIALLFLLPRIIYSYVYPAFIGILIMMFLQTNFLNGSLSSLAGDDMGEKTPTYLYIINTSVWVIVIAAVILLSKLKKTKGITSTAALILTIAIGAAQVANFSLAAFSSEGAFDSAIDRVYGQYSDNPRFLTNKDIEKFGSDRNVIVFCVDRFDTERYCEPAMKKYPETFAKLDGFTFYNDAISMYGNTFPSVGYMMSGIEYANDNHKDFFNDVYNNNKTLSVLHDAGYTIKLYSEAYYDYHNANEMPEYIGNSVETTKDNLEVEVRKPFRFGWAITQMSLYRSFPFVLKNTVGKMTSDTCNEYIIYHGKDFGEYESYSYGNKKVYDMIRDKVSDFCTDGEKNFTFIHIAGCHTADYKDGWKENKGKKSDSDYQVSAKLSIELITLYLDCMKEIDPELYRDSTIVILGDHGKVDNILAYFDAPMLTALFVKPSGVSGEPLKTSSAPVSHENLWATIFESEGLAYDEEFHGDSVFDVEAMSQDEWDNYERKFIWNKRKVDMDSYDSVEYKIIGEARDWDNWIRHKVTYIPHPLFAN